MLRLFVRCNTLFPNDSIFFTSTLKLLHYFDPLHKIVLGSVSSYHAYHGQLFIPLFFDLLFPHSPWNIFYWDIYNSRQSYFDDKNGFYRK